MNQPGTLKCTHYPSGRHVWEFLRRNNGDDIYKCLCKLQCTVPRGENPNG